MPAGDAVGSASTAPSYAAPREAQGPSKQLSIKLLYPSVPHSACFTVKARGQASLCSMLHPTPHPIPTPTWSNAALLPTPPQEGNEGLRMERDMRQVRGGLRSQFARFARTVAIQLSPPTSG